MIILIKKRTPAGECLGDNSTEVLDLILIGSGILNLKFTLKLPAMMGEGLQYSGDLT